MSERSEFWQNKIKAFLHDPPDKALILGSSVHHEDRRDRILGELKLQYGHGVGLNTADHVASAMQRLNFSEDLRKFHIFFTDPVKPIFKHTLSGTTENLQEVKDFLAGNGYEKMLDKYCFDLSVVSEFLNEKDWKKTYFMLWRFLPEKYSLGYLLPAETRIPDHGIWDHLDVTAAISSCLGDLGLFAVKIPAVQEFISQSRTLADLWASSHIFSTIIFEGMKTIVEQYGPDVVIFPQLRGNPMVDYGFGFVEKNKLKGKITIANFPNNFLCFIPASKAGEISEAVENSIRQKWMKIADKAKELLEENKIFVDEELWNTQIQNAIEITSVWQPFFNLDKFRVVENDIPEDLAEKQWKWLMYMEEPETNFGHFYSLTYEILGNILLQKSRFWNGWEEKPLTGRKCLMCGRRNAVIERLRLKDVKKEFYRFWRNNSWEKRPADELGKLENMLKENERLCAVCLTKRLYGFRKESVFSRIFGKIFEPPEQESVVKIAARDFIENIKDSEIFKLLDLIDIELIYEDEWKLGEKKATTIWKLESIGRRDEIYNQLKEWRRVFGEPNKYFAILMMDGDRIGRMLSGETLPNFGEFLHPAFRIKVEEWKRDSREIGKELVGMKRMLSPSHHIAISRAMKDFSLHKVPQIVKEHKGLLVYAGGDDVLALFPCDKVLEAAKQIQEFFKKDFYEVEAEGNKRKIMGLGNKASMSAGIIFAHYKWPLYDVIEKVRNAEKDAKEKYGRNAFCAVFVKRSGQILKAGGKWDVVNDLVEVAKAIVDGKVSPGFMYDFVEICKILKGNPLKSEVRRLLKRRMEKTTEAEIKEITGKLLCVIEKYVAYGFDVEEAGKALKILFDAYRGEER